MDVLKLLIQQNIQLDIIKVFTSIYSSGEMHVILSQVLFTIFKLTEQLDTRPPVLNYLTLLLINY